MNTVYSFVLCRSLPQTIDNLGQLREVMLLLISVKLSRKGDNPLSVHTIPIKCVAPLSDKRDNKEHHPFYSLGDRRMISHLQPISEVGRGIGDIAFTTDPSDMVIKALPLKVRRPTKHRLCKAKHGKPDLRDLGIRRNESSIKKSWVTFPSPSS